MRKNIDNEIVLTTYGYNTGLAIDPIEKKPLTRLIIAACNSILMMGVLTLLSSLIGTKRSRIRLLSWHNDKSY